MEKKRQIKFLALGAIVVAVAGMSFSFASMSTQLDIKGFATMGSADWDVHFENLSNVKLVGQALEITHPTITNKSTTISAFDVKLQSPQDSISYTFEIVNAGGMNAKVTTLNIADPVCETDSKTESEDTSLVCQNLEYTLTYTNGNPVKVGDVLTKNTKEHVELKLLYKGDTLPVEEVRITNLGITMLYSQN